MDRQDPVLSAGNTSALPILAAKLYRPPVTPDLERRTRLIERLEHWQKGPLTLISAPAGYGKTMLASIWLESGGYRNAWISLDERDNDLHTFVSYLLAALHRAFPTQELKTTSLVEAPNVPSVPVLARYLLNDLEQIRDPFILALDDIDRVQELSIFQLLDELLRHPLPSLHLLLIGRRDPPLQLASLRARSQLTEIRAQDLQFTAQETAGLLSIMLDRQVDEQVAADWARMTEGWVTALRLVALSLRHRGRGDDLRVRIQGDVRFLRDYLLSEVLARLPAASQGWLLKSALLNRFCASLIEAVCRTDTDPEQLTGKSFIDWLERENLFLVPLDDRGEWFRFHHLFQELLQNMLETQARPGEIAALRNRASRWCHDNNLLDEALEYAINSGDVKSAALLVQQHRYELMNTEQWHRLERWLEYLPENAIAQNPFLVSAQAHIAMYSGLVIELARALQRAEQLLADLVPGSDEYETIRCEIALIYAVQNVVEMQPTQAIRHTQSSLQRLPQQALQLRAMAYGCLAVALQMQDNLEGSVAVVRDEFAKYAWPGGLQAKMLQYLCTAFLLEGDLINALTSARTAQRILERFPFPETLSFCRYHLGVAHYLRNEFTQAEPVLQALLEDRHTSAPLYLANGGYVLALIYQAQGRTADVEQVINLLEAHFQETNHAHALAFVGAHRVELALRNRNLTEARALIKNAELDQRLPIFFFYVPHLTRIKLLLAEGKPESLEEAHSRLDVLAEAMRGINRKNVLIDVLALQALVSTAQADKAAAFGKLKAALELGVMGGNIRSFVDLGAPMADLLLRLRGHVADKEYAEYMEQIAVAFSDQVRATRGFESAGIPTATQMPGMPLADPLTMRERQVLKLLATDLSLQGIADQLGISLGTLQVHSKNIHRKLNVHNRVEAIEVAQKLDML